MENNNSVDLEFLEQTKNGTGEIAAAILVLAKVIKEKQFFWEMDHFSRELANGMRAALFGAESSPDTDIRRSFLEDSPVLSFDKPFAEEDDKEEKAS